MAAIAALSSAIRSAWGEAGVLGCVIAVRSWEITVAGATTAVGTAQMGELLTALGMVLAAASGMPRSPAGVVLGSPAGVANGIPAGTSASRALGGASIQ